MYAYSALPFSWSWAIERLIAEIGTAKPTPELVPELVSIC